MISIPDIVDYKPFYIQTANDSVARDTTEWGLVAKVNPYPLLPNPKEPYKNEWHDGNGDEEWVEQLFYESIEFSVSFYIKAYDSPDGTAEEVIRDNVDSFFSLIKNGTFKVFDSYNGIGRQNVRYSGFSEDSFVRRKDWARAIFRVTFKVNDPITRMVMYNGSIIEK